MPKKILILTGSIGSGHLSVARSIADALHRINSAEIEIEIVDFIKELKNFATTATKNIYLGSLKISPQFYKLIFSSTDEREWPLKLLNTLSIPFLEKKFRKLMTEQKPALLVSTFPIWDILIKKVWKQCSGRAPFVSVVTDSISVHNAWTTGNPDFYIVANEDTAIALEKRGIPRQRIKTFGFPVSQRFFSNHSCLDFQQKWNLSPKRKTLLLIISEGWSRLKYKKIIEALKKSKLKNLQLLIVASGKNERRRKKMQRMRWPWPTRITGFTNEMHSLIHGADIVLTKAGGSTVMECINSQKPMIIVEVIPGQEIGNAMLVQKYNLGVVLDHELNNFEVAPSGRINGLASLRLGLDDAIQYILKNESLIKKNLSRLQMPDAAEHIARFLTMLVSQ